jgi:hypothetical protein
MNRDYEYHKLKCRKCHRKILVQVILTGVSHNLGVYATCAECVGTVDANFRESNPQAADDVQKWLDEGKPGPCGECGGTGILTSPEEASEYYRMPCNCQIALE